MRQNKSRKLNNENLHLLFVVVVLSLFVAIEYLTIMMEGIV